ncbi:GNAT family N-acetyltransferase [Symbioplanes lichenis]|uniref:GNAT family N-acetyltransferase n=1 Tax=Symbioplanes lichenis TaxID=1629072 RepID=UPI00273A1D86|nr:GNAT family N-acetyltransferase [Actinoplanes lichenis]
MTYQVRPLGPEDKQQAWDLGSLTFGYHQQPMPDDWSATGPGRRQHGVFDPHGRLVAKALDRDQAHWFGGRLVPAAGIAGVATAPDQRGHGHGRRVLTHLLADARDRGAAISTLFDTTPAPYRALGWEEIGALTYFRAATRTLAAVRPDPTTTLRPATEADLPAVHDLYHRIARDSTGMMDRTGPTFDTDPAKQLADHHGYTVATDATGTLTGYATWDRGPGYDATGTLTVDDLTGLTAAATRTLLAMLGTWASVAPTTLLRLGPADPAWSLIARADAHPHTSQPWMLRIIDAPAAIAARGWPAHLTAELDLDLVDDVCAWHHGPHRLTLTAGTARLDPGGTGAIQLTPRGLAAWYAGATTPDQLRRAGFLTGGNPTTDAVLHAATAGPAPTLHDYF